MQINWFTVIAQIINFLILVWLMKKYLYKPILQAVDEREKKIASKLTDANSKEAEAKSEQAEFKKKNDDFDRHKKKMMDALTGDVETERQKLMDTTKADAAVLKLKLEEASKELQESLNKQLMQKTQDEVLSITQKVLSELASTNLEEQTVHVFIRNIKAITEKDKKQFIDAFDSGSAPLSIKSAFDLPSKEQQSIKTAIEDLIGPDVKYIFETDPKIIGGIELITKGYKLSWSFAAYISSLEKSIASSAKESLKADKE
ncbi:ATP synthase B chain [Arcticibacter svalbardensis MN12-7]|uniref:ATP synthase subunit b n=1 Tax=Arcticibacter svalbardensis MN12-7 TaxID=1150600 RepID=R9GYW9_9SPHI|nr:ATP synthase B chain [Arcticibacter svalbardensis]EOR96665.1 ATP synthase B chain [Arcticibacter svalbardensis MN12-7]